MNVIGTISSNISLIITIIIIIIIFIIIIIICSICGRGTCSLFYSLLRPTVVEYLSLIHI